jgi:chromate transporter
MHERKQPASTRERAAALEVLAAFLKLGLTSFGGPAAHIGFFRQELVVRRNWVTESQFAQLLAICQFLPGPASSQLGFSLGLIRAGWPGAIAAFIAFTLPSALLLFGFAAVLPHLSGNAGVGAIHGLKLVAMVFVAHAVIGMAHKLCPDPARQTIAALAAIAILLSDHAQMQLVVIIVGAIAGLRLSTPPTVAAGAALQLRYGTRTGGLLLLVFSALLIGTFAVTSGSDPLAAIWSAFYRTGALVFGGGHVVLPLLEQTVVAPGWIAPEVFLAGYGAAQAIPGPLFSVAGYLGAQLPDGYGGATGSVIALLAIFLPGFLLVAGALPFWRAISGRPAATRAIAGANAAVVGLLAAALYDPVFTSAVTSANDLAIGLIAFLLLVAWRRSALTIVLWCVLASATAAVLA